MPICAGTRCYFHKVDFFSSPATGEYTAMYGKQNILSVFFFPQNTIKTERLSVCILAERKKNETGSSGEGASGVLVPFLCPGVAVEW